MNNHDRRAAVRAALNKVSDEGDYYNSVTDHGLDEAENDILAIINAECLAVLDRVDTIRKQYSVQADESSEYYLWEKPLREAIESLRAAITSGRERNEQN